MSKMIKVDEKYKKWIEDVSGRFRAGQIKAAMKVNDEMLRFYWLLGHDIEELKGSYSWGEDLYSTISKDLTALLPDVKSFSSRNLRYMNSFYNFYPDAQILPQLGAKLETTEKLPQAGAKISEEIIFLIPWGHNKAILDKCKNNKDKALFL